MEYVYIVFLVGYYIFKYVSKKKKEEKAKSIVETKPIIPTQQPQRSSGNQKPISTQPSTKSVDRNFEKHRDVEQTVLVETDQGNTHTLNNDPTFKDIFKSLMEGGGDMVKQAAKPIVKPVEAVVKAQPKAVSSLRSTSNYKKADIKVQEKAASINHRKKTSKNIWRNTTLRDMVVVKTILDSPYIDKTHY